MNLDEVLDDIGLAFPYARHDVLAMPLPSILRLHGRAMGHLKRLYDPSFVPVPVAVRR